MSYPKISAFVFNPSHNEMLQHLFDIPPYCIFNQKKKKKIKFQKLSLFSFDVQSGKQQLIARHLKQKNACFSENSSHCGSFPQEHDLPCKPGYLPRLHMLLPRSGHSEPGLQCTHNLENKLWPQNKIHRELGLTPLPKARTHKHSTD